jgi:hypothetical protein
MPLGCASTPSAIPLSVKHRRVYDRTQIVEGEVDDGQNTAHKGLTLDFWQFCNSLFLVTEDFEYRIQVQIDVALMQNLGERHNRTGFPFGRSIDCRSRS